MFTAEDQVRAANWLLDTILPRLPVNVQGFCRAVTWRIVPRLCIGDGAPGPHRELPDGARPIGGLADPQTQTVFFTWQAFLEPEAGAAVVAHEIAHLWLTETRGAHTEQDADDQAAAWGFLGRPR